MKEIYNLSKDSLKNEVLIECLEEYDQVGLFKAIMEFDESMKFKVSEGEIFYDILGFQDTSNFAISEKLLNILKLENIAGWTYYEIDIENVDKKYFGFQCLGKCGPLIKPSEVGFYTGMKYDEDSWDGSGFFSPEETVLLFVTSQVREVLLKAEISNLSFTNITEQSGFSFG